MSLQATARAAFLAIRTAHPSAVVAVVYAGRTASGISDTQTAEADFGVEGEKGLVTGLVRVDASELDEPPRGVTITVAGVNVFVTNVRKDPAGALLAISWQKQNAIAAV